MSIFCVFCLFNHSDILIIAKQGINLGLRKFDLKFLPFSIGNGKRFFGTTDHKLSSLFLLCWKTPCQYHVNYIDQKVLNRVKITLNTTAYKCTGNGIFEHKIQTVSCLVARYAIFPFLC